MFVYLCLYLSLLIFIRICLFVFFRFIRRLSLSPPPSLSHRVGPVDRGLKWEVGVSKRGYNLVALPDNPTHFQAFKLAEIVVKVTFVVVLVFVVVYVNAVYCDCCGRFFFIFTLMFFFQ